MRRLVKRVGIGAAAVALLAGAADYGAYYWRMGRFMQSTDDAYVQADYTTVAPKVSGYVAQVLVEDNQPVKAGQILARIDDRDFKTALDQARSEVASAQADIASTDAQISLQQTLIDQAQASLASDRAGLDYARQDQQRYGTLSRAGYGSVQQSQQADATFRQKTAAVQADEAALAASQKQIEVLRSQRQKAETALERNQAAERQAKLNLGYTTISAPVDGVVGQRSLRVGQFVQAGTQLMAVVPLQSVYVVANYKETQLTRVRPGEAAEVEIDTFPGVKLKGHVDSLAPASGQTFALLPPDNATGNFTKVVQRIPVKIALDGDAKLAGLLRPGMSVEPTIDTRDQQVASGQAAEVAAAN